MGGRIYYIKRHPLLWAIIISFLLHLILLLFLFRVQGFQIGVDSQTPINSLDKEPIVFKIIESRDESLEKPEEASLFSDKQSVAKDMNPSKSGDQPFAESGVAFESLPQIKREEQQNQQNNQQKPVDKQSPKLADKIDKPIYTGKSQQKFDKNLLVKKPVNVATSDIAQPSFKQTQASAEDLGGISFNTYAWDYAPYILELKKRIQKNIFPPPAFTHLGFEGINRVRFKIMPNGQLVGPFLVDSSGEEALIETSKKAVQISAPFPPLPDDFPEKFLEVTAQFSYTIYGMNQ